MSECKTVENTTAAGKLLYDCIGDYKQEITITEASETVYALRDIAYALMFLTKHLQNEICLLYTSPSPRDGLLSRMPSSA